MKRSINTIKFVALALGVITLIGLAILVDRSVTAQSGTTYDAVADFVGASPQSGVWSYGVTQTRGTAFTQMGMLDSDAQNTYWHATGNGPYVARNTTSATLEQGSRSHPPDLLNLDPSFDGRNAVVRWTAPAAGSYRIAGRFQGMDNTTTDVAVLKNSIETLVSGNITAKGVQVSFDLTVFVAATDTIDFSVGQGTGGVLFDATGLAAKITLVTAGSCVPLTTGTVAWYRGEGNANDELGVNNGTLVNGATFAAGKVGQAFSFDGVNDHIRIAHNSNQNSPNLLSTEAWVYPTSFNGFPTIIAKWDAVNGNPQRSHSLHLDPTGKVQFHLSPNGDEIGPIGTVISSSSLALNTWSHVAGVYNGSSVKIYINGVLQGDVAYNQGVFAATTDLSIGAVVGGVPSGQFIAPFSGLIDEAQVINRALSQAEIQAVVNAGSAGQCAAQCTQRPAGLTAWYRGEGNANDFNSVNHGVLQNGASFSSGRVGQAFSLDGVDDYVAVPDADSLDLTGNLTIEGWVNPTDTSGERTILSKRTLDNNNVTYVLFLRNGQPRLSTRTAGGLFNEEVFATSLVPTNQFTHLAVTVSANQYAFYLNGQLAGQSTSGTLLNRPATDGRLTVGTVELSAGTTGSFAGRLDEITLYDRALSQLEVQAIANGDYAGKCTAAATPSPSPSPSPSSSPSPLPTPANDAIQNARVITGRDGSASGTNVGATRQMGAFRPEFNMPNEPLHDGKLGGKSVWFKWTAPANGRVSFRTSKADNLDTLLAAYQQISSSLVGIVSNDDRSSTDHSSRVEFLVSQGNVFYVAVDGYGGVTGNLTLRWTLTEEQRPQTISQRITRMTDTGNQDIVGVQLGRTAPLEIILRGENFTAQSQVLVNGDTCLRDANDGCEPNSSVQTTFRNDGTRLEVSIPPPFFGRVGTLRINVRTSSVVAANTGLLKVAEFNFVQVAPGQTADIQSNAPVDLRPPMRYSLQSTNTSSETMRFTMYLYAHDLYSFQMAYDAWARNGFVGDPPVSPDDQLTGASVAVMASPASAAAALQNVSLRLVPNTAALVGQDSGTLRNLATIVAFAPLPLVGQDGATLVGQDGATLVGQDGATLVGQDGGTLLATGAGNVVSDAGAGIISDHSSGVTAPAPRTFVLSAEGTVVAKEITPNSLADTMLRRSGMYAVRDSAGNNGQVQTGTDGNGNTTLTADINLNNTNSFPRVSALSRATSFSIALGPGLLQFSQPTYSVSEGQPFVHVTVTRTGNTSVAAAATYFITSAASAEFGITAGTATEGRDYEQSFGRLDFAPGDIEKSFDVSIINDSYGLPDEAASETFNIVLNNAQGAAVAGTGSARVTITDNDSQSAQPNAVSDTQFFVRQHYLDFLGREPDPAGLNFWVNQLTECQNLATADERTRCKEERTVTVSASFFLSIEFQETGFLVYRFYAASLPATSDRPRGFARYLEFIGNTQQVNRGVIVNAPGWEAQLAANQSAFALIWVQRAEFLARYPLTLTPGEFVDTLYQTAGITPSAEERAAAIAEYNSESATVARAHIVRRVADNQTLRDREFRRAFVLMEYFGYLRRSPDDAPDGNFGGYDFWLSKLNQFNGNFIQSEMVKAFILSGEFRQRFGQN